MATKSGNRDTYFELVKRFPLVNLNSHEALDRAVAMIDELLTRELDPFEEEYLDVLNDIVHKYETERHPIEPLPDDRLLRFLIKNRGIKQTDLAKAVKMPDSVISEVLHGRRSLTRQQIRHLAEFFHVSLEVFSVPTE